MSVDSGAANRVAEENRGDGEADRVRGVRRGHESQVPRVKSALDTPVDCIQVTTKHFKKINMARQVIIAQGELEFHYV